MRDFQTDDIGVYTFKNIDEKNLKFAGGKGSVLAKLYKSGFPVPNGFIILPFAFKDDKLRLDSWVKIKNILDQMRRKNNNLTFAVRSSGLSEDSINASFAGEFKSILNLRNNDEIKKAIQTVYDSKNSERVKAYMHSIGATSSNEISIAIQQYIDAEISGVLFTVDPINGDSYSIQGNYIYGEGHQLVSGMVNPKSFSFEKINGKYNGPKELKKYSKKIYKIACRLEKEFGDAPQDIEWVIAEGKLFLVQSRPITTVSGYNPIAGETNNSFAGKYFWSSSFWQENIPNVMTPSTWSIWQEFVSLKYIKKGITKEIPVNGNIAGRPYYNISLLYSQIRTNKNPAKARDYINRTLGDIPENVEIPAFPIPKNYIIRCICELIEINLLLRKKIPQILNSLPEKCEQINKNIRNAKEKIELAKIYQKQIEPIFLQCKKFTKCISNDFFMVGQRKINEISKIAGKDQTRRMMSYFPLDLLHDPSFVSLKDLARVVNGEMDKKEYIKKHSHEKISEWNLFIKNKKDDFQWLERNIQEFLKIESELDGFDTKRKAKSEEILNEMKNKYPKKFKYIAKRLSYFSEVSNLRIQHHSELTRLVNTIRNLYICSGEMLELGDDVFFLTVGELMDALSDKTEAVNYIPERKKTYLKYCSLPKLPSIIVGRFDPFLWVKDPDRNNRIFNYCGSNKKQGNSDIIGNPGSAGIVEGTVRLIKNRDEWNQFKKGEILVTSAANVSWTPLFIRASAIVTDVGAPLAHAAIVARELGIPAVVGCMNATIKLKTGDKVIVDGGKGTVKRIKW